MRLILLVSAFSVFSCLASEAVSHSGGLPRILQTGAQQNVESASAPTTISPRFAAYPICDLAAPHLMLGLPSLSSTHPPSPQAVWVAYYSRVIVAEHQPREVPLVKLYCASLATRKLLFQLDPVKYWAFEHIEQSEGVEQRTAAEEAQASAKLNESVEAGNEVGVLLLHPDIWDVNVVKALMTLGWQEMKFYETSMPVWVEWLEDEHAERESWMQKMDSEIEKIYEQMERMANEQMRAQIGDRMSADESRERQAEKQRASSVEKEAVKQRNTETHDASRAAAFGVGTKSRQTLFRRLGIREQLSSSLGRLEFQRQQMEGAREEMEKVNKLWNGRRNDVMQKWERFVGGAFERVERNNAKEEDGETWEEGLEWIAKKYQSDRDANKDACEGYMLEMVLDINAVNGITGRAWRHQAAKNKAFSELVNDYAEDDNGKTGGGGGENVEGVTISVKAEDSSASANLINSLFEEEDIEADIDWLVNEMLQDVNGLDMDVDEIVKELVEINEENLYNEIMEAAGGPDLAEAALAGMLDGVDEIVANMLKSTETSTGVDIADVNELVEFMMTGAIGGEEETEAFEAEDSTWSTAESMEESQEDGATTKSSAMSLPEDRAKDFSSVVM
eukprot:GHVS01078839.1.p1 GENE.GHVS01078839.1~~GHVS01078839.1.p1  ORF type:complete len:619 (+),score=134.40 GHVS01078839.1:465-2321(+)